MTRLRRDLERWARHTDRVIPGWRTPVTRTDRPRLPSGLLRLWLRHDREQLRRNVLLWQRAQMEVDRG